MPMAMVHRSLSWCSHRLGAHLLVAGVLDGDELSELLKLQLGRAPTAEEIKVPSYSI